MKKKINKKIVILILFVLTVFGLLFFSSDFLISKLKGNVNLKSQTSQINSYTNRINPGEILAEIKDDEGYIMFGTDVPAKMSSAGGNYKKYNVQVLAKFNDDNSEKKIVVKLKEGLNFTEDKQEVNSVIDEITTEQGINKIVYKNTASRSLPESEWGTITSGGKKIFTIKNNQSIINKLISFNFTISADYRLDFSSIDDAVEIELYEGKDENGIDKLISSTILKNTEYDFTSRNSVKTDADSNKINVFFNGFDGYAAVAGNTANSYVKGASLGFETYHNALGHKYVYYDYIDSYFIVPTSVIYKTLINNGNSAWETGIKYDSAIVSEINLSDLSEEEKNNYDSIMEGQNGSYKILKIRVEELFLNIFGLTPAWNYTGIDSETGNKLNESSFKVFPFKLEYKTYGMPKGGSVYNVNKVDNIFTIIDTEKLVLPADGEYCNLQCQQLFIDGKINSVKKHTVNEYDYNTIVKGHEDVDTPLGYYFYNNVSPLVAENKVLYFKFHNSSNNRVNSNINVTNIRLVNIQDYYYLPNYKIKFKKKIVTKKPNGDISVSYSDWSDKLVVKIDPTIHEIYSFVLTREKVNKSNPNALKINYVDDNGNIINEYFHELKYYIGNIKGNYDTTEAVHKWSYIFGGTLDNSSVESYYYKFKIEDEDFEECEKSGTLSDNNKICVLNNKTYKSTVDAVSKVNVKYPTETSNKYLFSGYAVNNTKSDSSYQDISYVTGNKEPYKFDYTIDFLGAGDQATETFIYNPVIYIKDIFYQENTNFGFNNIKLTSYSEGTIIDNNFIDKFNIYRGIKMGQDYYIVLIPKSNIKLDYPMLGFKTVYNVGKYNMKLTFDAKIPINYSAVDKINYFRDLVYVTTYDKNYIRRTSTYYYTHTFNTLELYEVSNSGDVTNKKVPFVHYSNDSVAFRIIPSGDIDSQILGKQNDTYIVWENESNNINTFDNQAAFRINLMNSTGKAQTLNNKPLEVYIPIPKENKNMFNLSLNNEFKYNTYLKEKVSVNKNDDNYEVYYANIQSQIKGYDDLKKYDRWYTYSNINLDDVNMIKVVITKMDLDENLSIDYKLKNTNGINRVDTQYFTYALYRSVENTAEIKEGWITGNTYGIESKNPIYKVTIKHLDINNTSIAPEEVIEKEYLSDYEPSFKYFSDYSHKFISWERNGEIQNKELGKITVENDEEIILRYSTLKNVFINYIDDKNNPLRTPIYLQAYDVKGIKNNEYEYNEFEYIPDRLDSHILNDKETKKLNNIEDFDGMFRIKFNEYLLENYYVMYTGLSTTLDNIGIYIIIFISSLSVLFGIIIYLKKRKSK